VDGFVSKRYNNMRQWERELSWIPYETRKYNYK
jgi:hypothetical protein